MARDYSTVRALRSGETVEVEGIPVRKISGEIVCGDYYVGERNTGPKLLTCKKVEIGAVFAQERGVYAYDIGECVRVEAVM